MADRPPPNMYADHATATKMAAVIQKPSRTELSPNPNADRWLLSRIEKTPGLVHKALVDLTPADTTTNRVWDGADSLFASPRERRRSAGCKNSKNPFLQDLQENEYKHSTPGQIWPPDNDHVAGSRTAAGQQHDSRMAAG